MATNNGENGELSASDKAKLVNQFFPERGKTPKGYAEVSVVLGDNVTKLIALPYKADGLSKNGRPGYTGNTKLVITPEEVYQIQVNITRCWPSDKDLLALASKNGGK